MVIASSDSFFLKWINQFVDCGVYSNYVVDHLPQDEAMEYWESLVDQDNGQFSLKFEDAYKYCGGCMHLMALTYRMYCATQGEIGPAEMSFVNMRRMKLNKAFRSVSCWKKDDLKYVMCSIVSSDNHQVCYDHLAREIGDKKVDEMIKENVIHLRPCMAFRSGIKNVSYPVIMPHLPCDVVIMEQILPEQ